MLPIISIGSFALVALAPTSSAFVVPPLPTGWRVESPCVLLNSASTIGIIWSLNLNTPTNCVQYCVGDGYTYAAVSDGSQCMCGNSYNPALATPAVLSECSTPCRGDNSQICGGQSRATVFTSVVVTPPVLPAGWTEVSACAIDAPNRVLSGDIATSLSDNTPLACNYQDLRL